VARECPQQIGHLPGLAVFLDGRLRWQRKGVIHGAVRPLMIIPMVSYAYWRNDTRHGREGGPQPTWRPARRYTVTTPSRSLPYAPGRPCDAPHGHPVIASLSREAPHAVLLCVRRERAGVGRRFDQGAATCPFLCAWRPLTFPPRARRPRPACDGASAARHIPPTRAETTHPTNPLLRCGDSQTLRLGIGTQRSSLSASEGLQRTRGWLLAGTAPAPARAPRMAIGGRRRGGCGVRSGGFLLLLEA